MVNQRSERLLSQYIFIPTYESYSVVCFVHCSSKAYKQTIMGLSSSAIVKVNSLDAPSTEELTAIVKQGHRPDAQFRVVLGGTAQFKVTAGAASAGVPTEYVICDGDRCAACKGEGEHERFYYPMRNVSPQHANKALQRCLVQPYELKLKLQNGNAGQKLLSVKCVESYPRNQMSQAFLFDPAESS